MYKRLDSCYSPLVAFVSLAAILTPFVDCHIYIHEVTTAMPGLEDVEIKW